MKKIALFFILLLVIGSSCKKDEEVDPRDQFVGSYTVQSIVNVPTLGIVNSSTGTCTISKVSDGNRIKITNIDGTTQYANVTGSNYVYEKYSETETIEGETATIEITGNGSISGNILTESGMITIYIIGESYTGIWSGTMVKQ